MKAPIRYQPHVFYLQEIIASIANELGCPGDNDRTLVLVNSVLSVIYRILPFSKAVQLFTALPLPLQALSIEQWKIEKFVPDPIITLSDLLDKIVASNPQIFRKGNKGRKLAMSTLLALLKVVSVHVNPKEMDQIIRVFPSDAQERIHVFLLSSHYSN